MNLKEDFKKLVQIFMDSCEYRYNSQHYETLPELVEVLDEIRSELGKDYFEIKMVFKES